MHTALSSLCSLNAGSVPEIAHPSQVPVPAAAPNADAAPLKQPQAVLTASTPKAVPIPLPQKSAASNASSSDIAPSKIPQSSTASAAAMPANVPAADTMVVDAKPEAAGAQASRKQHSMQSTPFSNLPEVKLASSLLPSPQAGQPEDQQVLPRQTSFIVNELLSYLVNSAEQHAQSAQLASHDSPAAAVLSTTQSSQVQLLAAAPLCPEGPSSTELTPEADPITHAAASNTAGSTATAAETKQAVADMLRSIMADVAQPIAAPVAPAKAALEVQDQKNKLKASLTEVKPTTAQLSAADAVAVDSVLNDILAEISSPASAVTAASSAIGAAASDVTLVGTGTELQPAFVSLDSPAVSRTAVSSAGHNLSPRDILTDSIQHSHAQSAGMAAPVVQPRQHTANPASALIANMKTLLDVRPAQNRAALLALPDDDLVDEEAAFTDMQSLADSTRPAQADTVDAVSRLADAAALVTPPSIAAAAVDDWQAVDAAVDSALASIMPEDGASVWLPAHKDKAAFAARETATVVQKSLLMDVNTQPELAVSKDELPGREAEQTDRAWPEGVPCFESIQRFAAQPLALTPAPRSAFKHAGSLAVTHAQACPLQL